MLGAIASPRQFADEASEFHDHDNISSHWKVKY
jgi:hypothetical protein